MPRSLHLYETASCGHYPDLTRDRSSRIRSRERCVAYRQVSEITADFKKKGTSLISHLEEISDVPFLSLVIDRPGFDRASGAWHIARLAKSPPTSRKRGHHSFPI